MLFLEFLVDIIMHLMQENVSLIVNLCIFCSKYLLHQWQARLIQLTHAYKSGLNNGKSSSVNEYQTILEDADANRESYSHNVECQPVVS